MLPAWVEELKRSAARAGALTALTRAKAWVPDLDLTDVAKGYPSLKEDGSEFCTEDLRAITGKYVHWLVNLLKRLIFHFTRRVMIPITSGLLHQLLRLKT